MTTARRHQVSLDDTPYYHCIARCVRRAFLCGEDSYSGQNFDHRRQWLVDRIKLEAGVFAIDICAYAIMSNHYHVVLRVDRDRANAWSDDEVIERWCQLYRGPLLIQRYREGAPLCGAEMDTVRDIVSVWRQRLMSISWFMGRLNEFIARQANKEDHCKGRFWEGRFKSQALLDDRALLACMVYVDLNPVRAAIASDLEGSDFTSIQERLRRVARSKSSARAQIPAPGLLPFADGPAAQQARVQIPFSLHSYIELADWTGRVIRQGKRGAISEDSPPALSLLNLNGDQWLGLSLRAQRPSLQAIGNPCAIESYNQARGKRWVCRQRTLAPLYNAAPRRAAGT
jgi:putative transposase